MVADTENQVGGQRLQYQILKSLESERVAPCFSQDNDQGFFSFHGRKQTFSGSSRNAHKLTAA